MDPNDPNAAPADDGTQAAPGPDTDDGMGEDEQGGEEMEMCVPLSSLSQPDEHDNMQKPGVGDPITMTVEGTISRVEGDNAYITPTAVNGQKIDNTAPMPQEDQLRQMAGAMPANVPYQ